MPIKKWSELSLKKKVDYGTALIVTTLAAVIGTMSSVIVYQNLKIDKLTNRFEIEVEKQVSSARKKDSISLAKCDEFQNNLAEKYLQKLESFEKKTLELQKQYETIVSKK